MRPRIYVAHPLGPDGPEREKNRHNAALWCAAVGEAGGCPIADWIILSGVWSEDKREMGLECDFAAIEGCHGLLLCGGRVSPGMALEKEFADRAMKVICDATNHGYGVSDHARHDIASYVEVLQKLERAYLS